MTTDAFFKESREQSRIKARIVAKYFWAWAKVITSQARRQDRRIAYVDLFAGPGRYQDDTPSTPIIVLENAIKEKDLRESLVALFNDKDAANVQSLQEAINAVPRVEMLKYTPQVRNEEVGQKIVEAFSQAKLVPTFLFADPWGYKGLSLGLINSVSQNWGSDCVLFFNYNRINPGLSNDLVRAHMNDIFGEARTATLREKLEGQLPEKREELIKQEFTSALKDLGAKFILHFTFKNVQGTRTKHLLIFTKNFKGYEIMKEIMAKESSERDQGVPSYEHSPAARQGNLVLFELNTPLDDLGETLLKDFAGQKLSMRRIYEQHSVDRPYVKVNYKAILTKLEMGGKIKANPPAAQRRRGTFGDDVVVSFPGR